MTQPLPTLAEAAAAGYTISPADLAEQTTLGYPRVLRAITGNNGPGLGKRCPLLPAIQVRLPNAPAGYRTRPADVEEWLQAVTSPWPLPADPIKSAQAIALLNGSPLPATSPEYRKLHARLAHAAGLRSWQILGQRRYSQAEVEQLIATNAERDLPNDRIPQSRKGEQGVSSHLVNADRAGEILGVRRRSGEPVSATTVTAWANKGLIPAVKLNGRWWFDPDVLATVEPPHEPKRGPSGEVVGNGGGKVEVGCAAAGCSEVLKLPWSTVYDIVNGVKTKRYVYHSIEHARASRDQWLKARGAKIMAPCSCVLDDSGTVCGRLARVRIGREHQLEDGWARCSECRRLGRWPLRKDGPPRKQGKPAKRSAAARKRMSEARKAAFEAGEPWAVEQAMERKQEMNAVMNSEKRRPDRINNIRVGRGLPPLSNDQWERQERKARSRRAKKVSGPKPKSHAEEWVELFMVLRDYAERREAAGDQRVSETALYYEVAREDYVVHPECWEYDPETARDAATKRVRAGIRKVLQTAGN